jgi:HAD superfamily hydrolase (TIGR01458 family)
VDAIRAVLADIDGVLTVSWRPVPGAAAALRELRESGYKIALLTNTSSRTRDWIAATLREQGFPVADADIFTVAGLTAAYLTRHYPGARCLVLNDGDLRTELPGVTLVGEEDPEPDVVVLGGAGPQFDYPTLNRVFGHLRRGASLVAMNANLYWQTSEGLMLDTGAFLPGLERAAAVTAVITGKPAQAFFDTALDAVGVAPAQAVMVGDDIDNDVLAAQRLGLTGVLVRTGKYQASTAPASAVAPDFVLDSVADLPALLAGMPSAGGTSGHVR